MAKVKKGQIAVCMYVTAAWVCASAGGVQAESFESNVVCDKTAAVVGLNEAAGGLLNVRSSPGKAGRVIGQVRLGDTVAICGELNGWSEIKQADGTGWVSQRFLSNGQTLSESRSLPPVVVSMPEEWKASFERRTFKLGTTISDFRRQPYPDNEKAEKISVVCTGDPVTKESGYTDVGVYAEGFKKAGLIKCVHYRTSTFDSGYKYVSPAGLTLGTTQVPTEFYFIAPKPGQQPVLFWITTSGPADLFGTLLPAFRKAYGSPTSETSELWQNAMGMKLDNAIVTWRNDVSEIRFKNYGQTYKFFELEHTLTPVMNEFNQRLSAGTDEAASKL